MDRRAFLQLAAGALAAVAAEGVVPRMAMAALEPGPDVGRVRRFVDRAGRAYLLEPAAHRVVALDAHGAERWVLGGDPQALNYPVAMADDAAGRLYVLARGSGRVTALDADGRVSATLEAAGRGADAASDLAVDAEGRLYVCQPLLGRVRVLDRAGRALAPLQGDGAFALAEPRAAAIDGLGRVHVVDAQRAQVVIFTAAGEAIGAYGGQGEGPGRFSRPAHICADGRGRLVVSDPRAGTVQAFTASGRHLTTWRPRLADGRPATPLFAAAGRGGQLHLAAAPAAPRT